MIAEHEKFMFLRAVLMEIYETGVALTATISFLVAYASVFHFGGHPLSALHQHVSHSTAL